MLLKYHRLILCYLKKLFNTDSDLDHSVTRNLINNHINNDDDDVELSINPDDISQLISDTKNKNKNDNVNIPLWLMKRCVNSFSIQLAVLFSHLLHILYVPTLFKHSIILPLYKGKGPRNVPKNYRPIVILNSYCKLFERYLYHRIKDRIDAKLIDEQHAYRSNKSCHSAISAFTTFTYSELDKKNGIVGAVFIDLKDAFSSISHDKLVRKLLSNFKLSKRLVKLIYCTLENRTYKFVSGDDVYCINTGVGQGSILGSILFSAFLDDVKPSLELQFLCYADDIIIYFGSDDINLIALKLQQCLQSFCDWCLLNDLNVNFDKTKCMYFHNERVPLKSTVNSIIVDNDKLIERVFSFKYLGLVLDPSLNFKLHYDHVYAKVCQCIKLLHGLKRSINEQAMKVLINTQVHSVIDYCIDIWTVQTSLSLKKVQDIIDNFLLSYYFPKLAKSYSTRKRSLINVKKGIDVKKFRTDNNLLTVEERSNYVLLKNAYKLYKLDKLTFSERSISYNRPNMCAPIHRTEAFKRSLTYRRYRIWNTLPKDWELRNMSYGLFQSKARDFVTGQNCDQDVQP